MHLCSQNMLVKLQLLLRDLQYRSVNLAQVAITHVKEALVKVGTFALQAAASSPIALVISAVILVLMVVSSLLPTFSLKTEDTTLTKLYKYCTELDAKFSEAPQLNRSGFDRIDFYQTVPRVMD